MPASLRRAKPPNEQIDGAASEVSLLELAPPFSAPVDRRGSPSAGAV